MNAFCEHHRDSIRWHYRCFDRILLNGLIQPFQQPERVVGFFNTYRQLYPVSRHTLRDIAEHGRLAIYTVLLTVFAADTVAYFVGRLFGRHKLAPVLSPGKTWEGFVAGSAAAVFVAFICLYETGFVEGWRSLVLGGVIAVSSALGDLFESALKRDTGVKDSGRLLAAHGGMLDRLDSHLFAGMAAFYAILALDSFA